MEGFIGLSRILAAGQKQAQGCGSLALPYPCAERWGNTMEALPIDIYCLEHLLRHFTATARTDKAFIEPEHTLLAFRAVHDL